MPRKKLACLSQMAIILAILTLIVPAIGAQATSTPSSWTWENFRGATQWHVLVTMDDTACGSTQPSTFPYDISIQHDLKNAKLGDLGHGPFSGTFSGNTLHVDARTVPDGSGTSELYAADIVFTPDCAGFSGKYRWDYTDTLQSCSGTTSFSGTRTGASGCPGPNPAPAPNPAPGETPSAEQIRQEGLNAHADLVGVMSLRNEVDSLQAQITREPLGQDNGGISSEDPLRAQLKAKSDQLGSLESKTESEYQGILKADPNNIWANWDMADLRRSQGDKGAYLQYLDKSVDSNPGIFESTRETLISQALKDMQMSKIPDKATSQVVSRLADEKAGWPGGDIYGQNVPKDEAGKAGWGTKLSNIFSQRMSDRIREAISGSQAQGQ